MPGTRNNIEMFHFLEFSDIIMVIYRCGMLKYSNLLFKWRLAISLCKQQVRKSVQVEDVLIAHQFLKDVVVHTPLQKNDYLSEKYDCTIYIKREDLQHVRSFKLRGAYYKIKIIENYA